MRTIKTLISVICILVTTVSLTEAQVEPGKAGDKKESGPVPIGMAVELVDHASCAHIAKNKGWFEEEGIKLKFYDSFVVEL